MNELSENPAWKGGRSISSGGYVYIRAEHHPRATNKGKYVFEHILIMEKYLGRFLKKDEVVHHIDGDKQNNNISNLELMTRLEHAKHHKAIGMRFYWLNKKRSIKTRQKMSESRKLWWKNKK